RGMYASLDGDLASVGGPARPSDGDEALGREPPKAASVGIDHVEAEGGEGNPCAVRRPRRTTSYTDPILPRQPAEPAPVRVHHIDLKAIVVAVAPGTVAVERDPHPVG